MIKVRQCSKERLPLFSCLFFLFAASFLIQAPAFAQKMSSRKLIQKILKKQPEKFQVILNNPEKYRVQILYTQIDREVGFPFMKDLGQAVYQYELKRKKEHLPNLDKFRIDYSEGSSR